MGKARGAARTATAPFVLTQPPPLIATIVLADSAKPFSHKPVTSPVGGVSLSNYGTAARF